MKLFGKKAGAGAGERRSSSASTANKGFIWAFWLLSTCGFGILLGGVAAMQNECGSTTLPQLTAGGGGSVGYLAPVSCDHFFQYTWWITFLHFFTWLLVLVYLAMDVIHRSRAATVGILAVASVLLMDTANTYLYFNYVPGLTSTMAARTRTTVAGAIVAAVADMLLILAIGWDSHAPKDKAYREEHYTAGTTGTTYMPATTTTAPVAATTTTTGTVPVQVPV